MTTVYIIRHAQAEGNLYRRCQGWYNSLITKHGYRQIAALTERFKDVHFDAVYSSDLFRTMTTAQSICRTHNLPLRLDGDLREVGMGIWEDWPWGEALRAEPESMAAFLRGDPGWHIEGSDTFPGAQTRFCSAVERHARAHPGQTIAIFAHGAIIRTSIAYWMGLSLDRISEIPLGDNTCVTKLELSGDDIRVCYYADIHHLGDLAAGHRHEDGNTAPGLKRLAENSVYFKPLDLAKQAALYLEWRKDGWLASHGTLDHFNGEDFLSVAQRNFAHNPNSILIAYAKDTPVGMIQMDQQQEADFGVGRIPFLYICPEYRSKGYGSQLLGEAVSTYRKLGRNRLRLRCAPENHRARQFYERCGFDKVGEESGGIGHLDTLEMYIGIELK